MSREELQCSYWGSVTGSHGACYSSSITALSPGLPLMLVCGSACVLLYISALHFLFSQYMPSWLDFMSLAFGFMFYLTDFDNTHISLEQKYTLDIDWGLVAHHDQQAPSHWGFTVLGCSAEGATGDQWPAAICQQMMCPLDCICPEGPFSWFVWKVPFGWVGALAQDIQGATGVSWELLESKDWVLFIFTSPALSTVLSNNIP